MEETLVTDSTKSGEQLEAEREPGRVLVIGHAYGGKSSLCRGLARLMSVPHIDSGLLFRAITHVSIKHKLGHEETDRIANLANSIRITVFQHRVICDNDVLREDVLKSPAINRIVPYVAAIPGVRDVVVRLVHQLAGLQRSWVIGGRSPDEHPADHVVWVTASLEVRTQRLMHDMQQKGTPMSLGDAKKALLERDKRDMEREASPMYCPAGALVVDTTSLTVEEAIEHAHQLLTP